MHESERPGRDRAENLTCTDAAAQDGDVHAIPPDAARRERTWEKISTHPSALSIQPGQIVVLARVST